MHRLSRRSFMWFLAPLWPLAAHAGLPETIAQIKPSVVLVGTFKATDNPRFQLRGTGFIVGDGQRVVTNAHVLPAQPAAPDGPQLVVQVRQANDEWQMRPVQLLGQDLPRDLALLRMAGPPGPALVVGDSTRVREGEELAFMGFPIGGALGFSAVTHRALVASITPATLPSPTAGNLQPQAIRGLREGRFDIFQLDAVAYPGNSGGPLFHPQTGEVLGVLNMVLVKSRRESVLSNPSGIAYAIPARHVRELMERHP
mgnify:CR=1 FL=1